ncbi:YT521-B-like domain-containing protein [Schizophyllum commune]
MAPDSGRLAPLGHPGRPQQPPSLSQRSQRPLHSDLAQVGTVGPPPFFGQHAYAPASGSHYNQGSGFANQYTLAQPHRRTSPRSRRINIQWAIHPRCRRRTRTRRHTRNGIHHPPVLASPAPAPRSAVPMASSDRPPVVPGSVSSPLALSPPSSQQSPRPESNSGSSYRAAGSEPTLVCRPYHPNPPAHRSEWVGNVPSDATHEELYRFFNVPYAPGENTTGVVFIFPISRSNCAFVNYYGQDPLEEAVERFNGKQLRPNDPRCPGFVCRVRKVYDDLKAGVGAQRGMSIRSKGIRDQNKNKLKAGPPSVASASSAASKDAPPTTPSSASGDVAGMSNLSMSSNDQFATTGLKLAPTHLQTPVFLRVTTRSGTSSQNRPRRYVARSHCCRNRRPIDTQYDLDLSVEKGVCATQKHNEGILDQAYHTSKDVYLIFGVNKSGEFYGYARMAGPVKGERKVSWASRAGDFSLSVSPTTGRHNTITAEEGIASAAAKSTVTNFLSPASGRLWGLIGAAYCYYHAAAAACEERASRIRRPPPALFEHAPRWAAYSRGSAESRVRLDETAPLKAQRNAPASATTTDASVRAPGEREQSEPSKPSIPSRTDSGREETWGESFKVEWLCTKRLSFFRTRHLRNFWNYDREVKVSRDGTELEPAVGQHLLDEWENLASEPIPSLAAETSAAKDAPRPHESSVATVIRVLLDNCLPHAAEFGFFLNTSRFELDGFV